MGKTSIYQLVSELIEPTVTEHNAELVDVEYIKAGKVWTLRVFIDKKQGITVLDCQKLSREIEDLIEVHELISDPYTLEVSSPGLDRLLKKEADFLRNKDKQIQLKTYAPIEGRKNFSGIILDVKNKILFLVDKDDCLELELANIAQAKLVIKF
jgi:ribosome maturation factor RimP